MNPTAPRHSFPGTPGAEAINEERSSHQSTPDFLPRSVPTATALDAFGDSGLQRTLLAAADNALSNIEEIANHNSLENSQEYEQIQDFLLQRRMTKAACKFAGNLPIFAVKFAHSIGQFARGDLLTGYIEPSSCTTDIRKRDKTETGRDRNGMKTGRYS
ncbi:hypothetical protein G5I_03224 [Acromyrmex echinatior]|uniref:Uncharacterized protein n=1 Tax=Acromyrmex echinatior TaxID=103372 RepID=F4WCF0_ACREC|nr:hypothetical protein G5I_03224 [Acromyrmex echinatior]